MTFLELCRRRRSVRAYAPGRVPREALERCLEAARLAPSACNSQPWRFIVVERDDLRARLAEAAFSGLYAMNRFAAQAPVLIVVVTERSTYAARLGGLLRGTRYALLDVGAAVEHLVLQATEEGLGTCWIGWFNERAVKQVLGLPRRAKVDILLAVGYPADEPGGEKVRKPLDDVRQYR